MNSIYLSLIALLTLSPITAQECLTAPFLNCASSTGIDAQACANCLDNILTSNEGTSCNSAPGSICPAIQSQCSSSCGQCIDEATDFAICVIRESGCSSFSCSAPVSAPTTSPPGGAPSGSGGGSSDNPCPLELSLANQCLQANAVPESCLECLRSDVQGSDLTCSIVQQGLCPAFDRCESQCAPCRSQLQTFFTCDVRGRGCPSFSCMGGNGEDADGEGMTGGQMNGNPFGMLPQLPPSEMGTSSSGGLSTVAIISIAAGVGGVVVVLIAVFVGVCLCRRRRRNNKDDNTRKTNEVVPGAKFEDVDLEDSSVSL